MLRIALALTLVLAFSLDCLGSTPIHVRKAKDASVVPNASVEIHTTVGQTRNAIPPGGTGPNGEAWNAETTALDGSQEYRVFAETRNPNASGWADIVFQNGDWGEKRSDGTWIEPPIVVRIRPRLNEQSCVPARSGEEFACSSEMRWVSERCQDQCGRCYEVYKPVYCTSYCRVQTTCVPSVSDCCDRRSADNGDSVNFGKAKLTVLVPADAAVFINGRRTTRTGDRRVYLSNALVCGHSYRYVVRAQVVRDGKVVEDTQEVILSDGDSKSAAFDFSGGVEP